jgi:hypothetical protein
MDAPSRTASVAIRTLVDAALAAHLVGAAVYWWFCPKGFPIEHARLWLNSVLPLFVVAACIALIVMHRRRRDLAALAIICLSFTWAAAAILGNILFPISLRGLWGIGLAAILVGLFFSALLVRQTRLRPWVWLPCLALSSAVGGFPMWAQRPAPASTTPFNEEPPGVAVSDQRPIGEAMIPCGPNCQFDPNTKALDIRHQNLQIYCEPMLDFHRISPDGFWSLRAPARGSRKDQRLNIPIAEAHFRAVVDDDVQAIVFDEGSAIELPVSAAASGFNLTAYTRIGRDTYSHLNTYCLLSINGHRSLSLSFSPTGNKQIDVPRFDYPFGRAARFAYFDEDNVFHVVEASSGEKGPFHSLASGHFHRGEPLTITICDDGRPAASLTLGDWSRQLSTELSPTAGWNVPMNAIEFFRTGDSEGSPVQIAISLAATSVGRGWDTVGHRAGVYRNRLRFQFDQ